jgi:hypothetical protein
MSDVLTQLREEQRRAAEARDVAQTVYAALAVPGERLLQAISEHRAQAAELAAASDDDQYGGRLAELTSLEREISTLRSQTNISEFHDSRRALAAANATLDALGARYEEACWSLVPAACAHLFTAAEDARLAFEAGSARIDSVAAVCHETAHQQRNGGDPRLTPAWRAYLTLSAMAAHLTTQLGANATRDFRTGPELLAAINDGSAEFGDISRWTSPSTATPDGSVYLNRAEPDAQPQPAAAEPGMPNPALSPSLPPWLEPQPG